MSVIKNDKFELVFEGLKDQSPESERKVKSILVGDLELPIPEVQKILSSAPYPFLTAETKTPLLKAMKLLKSAGAEVSINEIEVEDPDEEELLFEVDISELDDKKRSNKNTKIWEINLDEDDSSSLKPTKKTKTKTLKKEVNEELQLVLPSEHKGVITEKKANANTINNLLSFNEEESEEHLAQTAIIKKEIDATSKKVESDDLTLSFLEEDEIIINAKIESKNNFNPSNDTLSEDLNLELALPAEEEIIKNNESKVTEELENELELNLISDNSHYDEINESLLSHSEDEEEEIELPSFINDETTKTDELDECSTLEEECFDETNISDLDVDLTKLSESIDREVIENNLESKQLIKSVVDATIQDLPLDYQLKESDAIQYKKARVNKKLTAYKNDDNSSFTEDSREQLIDKDDSLDTEVENEVFNEPSPKKTSRKTNWIIEYILPISLVVAVFIVSNLLIFKYFIPSSKPQLLPSDFEKLGGKIVVNSQVKVEPTVIPELSSINEKMFTTLIPNLDTKDFYLKARCDLSKKGVLACNLTGTGRETKPLTKKEIALKYYQAPYVSKFESDELKFLLKNSDKSRLAKGAVRFFVNFQGDSHRLIGEASLLVVQSDKPKLLIDLTYNAKPIDYIGLNFLLRDGDNVVKSKIALRAEVELS
jgi:hypothetical protein